LLLTFDGKLFGSVLTLRAFLQVMDELKVLQLQVNDRPSTSDVSNMMEGISHTFRKYVLHSTANPNPVFHPV
jgi:hypothetical protein